MKALLGAQDAWELVTTEYEEPKDVVIGAMNANQLKALKEKHMKAKIALYLLFQSMDESGFEKIVGASTAKQAWDTMEKGYKGVDRVKQESKDLENLTIEDLAGCLEAHEQIKNKKKQESVDEALKTKAAIKDKKESEQRGKHLNQNSRGRGRGRGRGGQGYCPSVDCYNCGKQGHYARDYRSAKRTEEKTNLVTEVEESGVLLMAHEESISKIDTMWPTYGERLLGTDDKWEIALEKQRRKCLKDDLSDEESVWHLRFGHLHFNGLKELTRKNMVYGLPNLEYDGRFCESFIFGKQTRSSFPRKATYEAKELLELIHIDLCGPLSPVSFRNKRYFINFIDDFTRKCWVYFLEQKSKALETFKKFKALVEKTTGKCIKALRSNRGGEFVSTPFTTFCEEEGIKKFLTAPYSPQQNGIAERKNRTIMTMPTVSHFRVFGSVAYAHVPDQTRKKLDDKSKMYIFIGYDERTKAFRLYDHIEKKVIVSRDVFVNKERTWDWSNEYLYDPHKNTEHDAREVCIPIALSDPTVVTTDSENDDEPIQPRMRSLQDIYNNTTEMHLVCLLADNEDITLEEAIRNKKWKEAMDEEISAIEKNKT
uniref:Retrovirus-related Pol polyprotein from transposon TNT 1-94 n=1 Tax=Tanacetum cinerariifolium TaxID=118510 RepID=A0A699HI37_TANCI|nr:retrovirus-related Pol polyprotein from transposon TNT 1-94 [Tanacetum cinerariifolium]